MFHRNIAIIVIWKRNVFFISTGKKQWEKWPRQSVEKNVALHTGNNFVVARVRTVTNIHEHFHSPRSAVHTKFYGSARRRLLHRSFLFASGKYLTPYSGLFWQLARLSLYLNRPRRFLYTSSSLCSQRTNLRKP